MNDKSEISVNLLRLADGTLIDPSTRRPLNSSQDGEDGYRETPTLDESSSPTSLQIVPDTRRSLLDLTLSYEQMAVVNNVLVYTLWGLPDDEIAIVCGCSSVDVDIVRQLPEYKSMQDAMFEGLRKAYMSNAAGVLAEHSVFAAKEVISQLRSKSGKARLDAAKDILDRSGHRPADHASVAINLNGEDGLVIKVVRESERPRIPTIELNKNA